MKVIYHPHVARFVSKTDRSLSSRIMKHIDILEKRSYDLEMPFSKALGRGLFELRILGNKQVRIFYCFHDDAIYLLHAIEKKQSALPKRDIETARKIMKELASI